MRKEPSIRHYVVVNMPIQLLERLDKKRLNIFLNNLIRYISTRAYHRNESIKYIVSYIYECISLDILIYIFCKNG